jgi:hypothetical protein
MVKSITASLEKYKSLLDEALQNVICKKTKMQRIINYKSSCSTRIGLLKLVNCSGSSSFPIVESKTPFAYHAQAWARDMRE